MHLKQYTRMEFWLGRRFWESRQFYSAYIALFIAVSNWITIQYALLLEHLPSLNYLFSNIWVFTVVSAIFFVIISILGGHYIHRKKQFRIEQAMATEENPYLYRSAPGKERDLIIPMGILQLDSLQELLRVNNLLTDEKKKQFEGYKQSLTTLRNGHALGMFAS